jgi:hypothetical protein
VTVLLGPVHFADNHFADNHFADAVLPTITLPTGSLCRQVHFTDRFTLPTMNSDNHNVLSFSSVYIKLFYFGFMKLI